MPPYGLAFADAIQPRSPSSRLKLGKVEQLEPRLCPSSFNLGYARAAWTSAMLE